MRSPRTARAIALVLWALAFNAGAQAVAALVGWSDDPPLLTVLQSLSFTVAVVAAVGAWRLRLWSRIAAVAYGLVAGGMIVSLGRILDLSEDARAGLNAGGGIVLLIGLAMSWGLHWALQPASTPVSPTS